MKELIVQVPDDLARLFIETDEKKELVRCKDCQYFFGYGYCEKIKAMRTKTDYCSYAEPTNG